MPTSSRPLPSHLQEKVHEWPKDGKEDLLPDLYVEHLERLFDKLAHAVHLSRREDKIIRGWLLEHEPHALDVVAC